MQARTWALGFVLLANSGTALLAQSAPVAVVLSGSASPAGGTFGTFPTNSFSVFLPVINNNGTAQFFGSITGGTSTAGLFTGTPGTLTPFALQGQAAPAGGNFTNSFSDNRLTVTNQVAFSCTLSTGIQGLYAGTPGALQTVALDGTASPGGGGNYNSGFSSPLLNPLGRVLFAADLTGGTATRGLFTGTPGSIQAVALQGSATPAGGTYSTTFQSTMNGSGVVAVNAVINGIPGVTSATFYGTAGSMQTLALQGAAAPAGGNYNNLNRPFLNNAGQAVFSSTLTGGSATSGIFVGTPGSLQTVALQGTAAPSGGNFSSFNTPQINGAGQIIFHAALTGGSAPAGIFMNTSGITQTVVLFGTAAPGGGTLNTLSGLYHSNEQGQIAFLSTLTGAGVNTSNDVGLYLGTTSSLLKIVREGDQIDVDPGVGVDLRTVLNIGLRGVANDLASGGQDSLGTALTNNFLTYNLSFTDGTSGVFYTSLSAVPEPATVALVAILIASAGGAAWQYRRRQVQALQTECEVPE